MSSSPDKHKPPEELCTPPNPDTNHAGLDGEQNIHDHDDKRRKISSGKQKIRSQQSNDDLNREYREESETPPKREKSDDPAWIETMHERYSTKAIRAKYANQGLWPPDSATDEEHLIAQIRRRDMYTSQSEYAYKERLKTTIENHSSTNDLRQHGISVKHFTGDEVDPFEMASKWPSRPEELDRDAVKKWAK